MVQRLTAHYLATVCLAALCLGSPAHAEAVKQSNQAPARPATRVALHGADFYVVNATQVPITGVQVSRSDQDSWGEERLGGQTLAPGAQFLVRLPNDGKCEYDLRVVFRGGNVSERRHLAACDATEFRMTDTGAPPRSEAAAPATPSSLHVTFTNGFRRTLTQLRVSPAANTQWGDDRLGEDTIPSQGEWSLDLPAGQGCQYDLQASFDRASPEVIRNVNLCTGSHVSFSGPRPGSIYAYGTGFRVSASGHIMTNNHVVQGCGSVAILAKDQRLPLRVLGQDPIVDLAMLQQPDMVTPFLSFRTAQSPVRLAERAISIGYPIPDALGDRVVTEGIVNALTGGRGDATQYQLQTPIQPGNSGGPIFDRNGLVIGVAVAGIDRSGDRIIQNVNFAVSPVAAGRFAQSLGVQLRYEPGTQELSTADVMERNGDRVVQLVCLN